MQTTFKKCSNGSYSAQTRLKMSFND